MTLIIAQIVIGFLIGTYTVSIYRRMVAARRTAEVASRRLTNLRRNAFLTDERGHRRRYADCSAEVRAKAED